METTLHPDEGLIQALLDGELAEPEATAAAAHVQMCEACAAVATELQHAAGALRDHVVAETPAVAVEATPPHPAFLRRRGSPMVRTLTRAAGIVVLLGGSAAVLEATTGWLGDAVRAFRGQVEAPVPPVPVDAPVPVAEGLFTVQPRGGTLEVLLEELPAGSEVFVRLGDVEAGELRTSDAEGITYRAGPGTATAVAPGVARVDVVLPRTLQSGRVVVNGETAVVKAPERLFPVRDAEESSEGFRILVDR